MPRKAKPAPPEEALQQPVGAAGQARRSLTRSLTIMGDGRVEAALKDHPVNPVREMICRTSLDEAIRFIMNDFHPDMMEIVLDDTQEEK